MRVVSVVGARPQFVKLAPIARAFEARGLEHLIVHTGQHYDSSLSSQIFRDLAIPDPHVSLNIGSGGHGAQTGAMLSALEPTLKDLSPDWVLVYGDTNSTLAGAVAAVKIHLRVAHLEAGLRSFNRKMPEEINRVLTDHASDLLLAPTRTALSHLAREGLDSKALIVGDVMADICLAVLREVNDRDESEMLPKLSERDYVVATLHRAENTDDPERLRKLLRTLQGLPIKVILPLHPRLRERAAVAGVEIDQGAVSTVEPLPYSAMLRLVGRSLGVITDSGGLQKEAYILGTPCTTLRFETEWPETLDDGWNILDPGAVYLPELAVRSAPLTPRVSHFGDGFASQIVAQTLLDFG